MKGNFIINGKEKDLIFEPDERLLITLRQHGYTEVKNGCQEGECGACLILLDGKPINSCQVLTASVIGQRITTIKGIGNLHAPHVIQQAFVEAGAIQCGFCTPGMIISSFALLRGNRNPSIEEIKNALDGNLCRCTGYLKIIDAIRLAAKYLQGKGRSAWEDK